MEKIIKPFVELVFGDHTVDFTKDTLQLGIDSFVDEPLKRVPFASFIINSAKLCYNVHDRNLLNQAFTFVKEFYGEAIEPEKLQKYKDSIEEDSKKAEEELGRVLIILNRTIDFEKTIILAKLYRAYINEKIEWDEFVELSEVNERLFVNDISIVLEIYKNGISVDKGKIDNLARIVLTGLLKNDGRFDSDSNVNDVIVSDQIDAVKLTALGNKFCSLIQKNV